MCIIFRCKSFFLYVWMYLIKTTRVFFPTPFLPLLPPIISFVSLLSFPFSLLSFKPFNLPYKSLFFFICLFLPPTLPPSSSPSLPLSLSLFVLLSISSSLQHTLPPFSFLIHSFSTLCLCLLLSLSLSSSLSLTISLSFSLPPSVCPSFP